MKIRRPGCGTFRIQTKIDHPKTDTIPERKFRGSLNQMTESPFQAVSVILVCRTIQILLYAAANLRYILSGSIATL